MIRTAVIAAPARRAPMSYRPVCEALEDRCLMAADPILEWNAVALEAVVCDHTLPGGTQRGPTLTARALAMAHLAMFDAANSVLHYWKPYLTVVNVPGPASLPAAVAQAAHDTLAALYPSQTAAFDTALAQTLARVPNGLRETRGIFIGKRVAERLLAARANDGAGQNGTYTPTGAPGNHDVDPLHPDQGFYGPAHGSIQPFGIGDVANFRAAPPPELDSQAYQLAYNEVMMLGGDGVTTPTLRTQEQTEIGLFWAYDGSPGLGTPPRLYNQIARTVAIQQGNTVARNARLFALLNMAQADAGIASWESKYEYDFWRPILGVRNGDVDGNDFTSGDVNWTPLGAPRSNPFPGETDFTPNFPAYVSGHATFGAATFQTLTRFFGRDNIPFTFMSDEMNGITRGDDNVVRPQRPRSFTSFSQAKEENGQSRIYLGIHWAFDKTEGIKQGDAVANHLFQRFLRPGFPPAPHQNMAGMNLTAAALVQPLAETGAAPIAPLPTSPIDDALPPTLGNHRFLPPTVLSAFQTFVRTRAATPTVGFSTQISAALGQAFADLT